MKDYESIRQLILNDHPQFQTSTQRWNTDGWDNLILILDERVVFRIPRNELSRRQLQVELQTLPCIAAASSLPVPVFRYFSEEPGIYAGYELIPGQPFARDVFNTCTKSQQKEIARQLGAFLSELHNLNVNKAECENVPVRRQTRQSWLDLQSEVLIKAGAVLEPIHKQKIEEMFEYILNTVDFDNLPKTLIHGDLSADHILYDTNREGIRGIIDFGDLMIGDAAYDFTGILLEYGHDFLDEVMANYGPALDAGFLERVERFYLPKVALHRLLYGLSEGDEHIVYLAVEEIKGNQ